jgi:hypothetical protein
VRSHSKRWWIQSVVRGYFRYHAVPGNEQRTRVFYGRLTNYRSIRQFYRVVQCIWRKWLSRRTRGRGLTWERFDTILRQYPLLPPRITHTWAAAGSHA